MIFEPRNRLSSKALKVWKIHGAMITILFWLFLIGASLLIVYQQWPVWLIGAGLLIGLLQLYLSIFFLPAIKWKRWRYEIREQEIDL
ncbi:MAG TPA: hypothetical protein VEY51_09600, partial [Chondromyces sp.]|nr:hypothetical protein [Chondromyces sp.]